MRVRSLRLHGIVCVGVLTLGGCTFKVMGGPKVGLQVLKKDHKRPPPPADPSMNGVVELRLDSLWINEKKTIVEHKSWRTRVGGVVVSPERLELASLEGAFTLIGASGTVYETSLRTRGGGWKKDENDQWHLPAGEKGWISVSALTEQGDLLDEPVVLTFGDQRMPLSH